MPYKILINYKGVVNSKYLVFPGPERTELMEFPVTSATECCRMGDRGYLFRLDIETILFVFKDEKGKSFCYLTNKSSLYI